MQVNVGYEPGREGERGKPKSGFSNEEKTFRTVFSDRLLMSIFILHSKYRRGEVISRTFYQRKEEWNNKKKSRFIESLLLNLPIPLIYMRERSDGKIEVVDGQQRLGAVFDFFNNRYALTGLSILKDLNGKRFRDFETGDTVLQRKLEEYPFSVSVIKKESPPGIELEMFERLNR